MGHSKLKVSLSRVKKGIFQVMETAFMYSDLTKNNPAITCPKLTIETLEQGVRYVQS